MDLVQDGIDVALRIGAIVDESMVALALDGSKVDDLEAIAVGLAFVLRGPGGGMSGSGAAQGA